MALSLTDLQNISEFAGWGASGRLLACGKGSTDITELRRIRSWIRAGCHGLSIPWTSLKNIADYSGIRAAANLCQTERGHEMMKLLRKVTALTITRNWWRAYAENTGGLDMRAIERRVDRELQRRREIRRQNYREDSDDENVAMWRRWAGDD